MIDVADPPKADCYSAGERNALGVPYSWLLRPRFWVYAWIAVDAYLLPGWLNLVVGLFAAVLAWKLWTGFVALRRLL